MLRYTYLFYGYFPLTIFSIFNFQLSVFNFLGRSGKAVGLSAISLLASFPTRTQKLSSALRQAQ